MKRFLFFSILSIFCLTISAQNWVQLGNEINGEAVGERSGIFASISADGSTVAIGAPDNHEAGNYAGQVRAYAYDGTTWSQKGSDISGEAAGDHTGPVGLSADGNTLVIGAPGNDNAGTNFGNVRVFDFNGTNWIQRGASIPGEDTDACGNSVGISANGNRVVIGSRLHPIPGLAGGQVRVFEWNGSSWAKLGSNINGKAVGDEFGTTVRISADGNTFIAGAQYANVAGNDSGEVSVYQYNGTDWELKGDDIPGEKENGYFGCSVDISEDGNTIIGGEVNFNNSMGRIGRARAFTYNGTNWVQKGQNLDGLSHFDGYGSSVAINNAGNIIAVKGSFDDATNNLGKGRATIYSFNGTNWVQLGSSVNGQNNGDECGTGLSFSDSGDTIVIGSPVNGNNGAFSGQTRVFRYDGPLAISKTNLEKATLYPNPTNGNFTIDLGKEYTDVSIQIYNMLGQLIAEEKYASAKKIQQKINTSAGVYFTKVNTAMEGSSILRIIKQ